MHEIILCKLGEIVLKGLNRHSFEMKLMSNIRRRTAIHILVSHRISGSGAERKSIRHTQRKQPSPVNAWQKITSLQNEQRARILKPQV